MKLPSIVFFDAYNVCDVDDIEPKEDMGGRSRGICWVAAGRRGVFEMATFFVLKIPICGRVLS